MKTLKLQSIKTFLTVLILLTVTTFGLFAQTPQYYNYQNVGTSSNSFPFGQTAGKGVNWIFLPGDFTQPSPLPSGQQITKVYFFISSSGSRTYTDLHILMAQDTINTLTSGQFYSGTFDTVYHNASVSLTGTSGTWMSITLDTPYPYDTSKSLLVFVGQCGAAGSGISVRQNGISNIRRVWSVGGCPFTPYAGGDANIVNFGVDVEPAVPPVQWPEVLYYKFWKNPTSSSIINYAVPGQGTNPATVTGHTLGAGGQFDSCLVGAAGTGANCVNTGWSWNLSGNWTMSFWVSNLAETSSGSPTYLFGDAGASSFRCFYGGAAYPNNMYLRGAFSTSGYLIACPMPGSHVFHIVFDGSNYIIYRDGVLLQTNPSTTAVGTGSGFKVGGYSTSSYALNSGGKMDEFRLYNRALTPAEVAATWNQNIGVITGVTPKNLEIPEKYSLSQNYPNPFNPVTSIEYSLPKAGFVELLVFDILGREVKTLVKNQQQAGKYIVDFNASEFTSGTYFYRLKVNDYIETKKMILIK